MNRAGITQLAYSTLDRGLQVKNRHRPRILVYTDSRGLNFTSPLGKRHYGSHVWLLQRKYHVTYAACPEKHTTILDFLRFTKHHQLDQFAAVVLHCGVVDFSPRPLSNVNFIRKYKSEIPEWERLFSANSDYHAQTLGVEYEGEPTTTLYSQEYLGSEVIPRLSQIERLVWISSNRFVAGWEGNYVRGRPANIESVVGAFDALMCSTLPNVVDLHLWSDDEVKRWTMDNVHFTRAGFGEVFREIDETIGRVMHGR